MADTPKPPKIASRPTLDTMFVIDYDWWGREGKDFNSTMTRLCNEHGYEIPEDDDLSATVDFVDPETAQVFRIRKIVYHVVKGCGDAPDFLTERTSLTEAIFRALLISGNQPLTVRELAERTGRDANTILRTLSGQRIYQGIRRYEG